MVARSTLSFAIALLTSGLSSFAIQETGLNHLVAHVQRLPNLTQAEFFDYWQNQHAPKFIPIAMYYNITRYEQVCGALFNLALVL
jgi:hypothetical protein